MARRNPFKAGSSKHSKRGGTFSLWIALLLVGVAVWGIWKWRSHSTPTASKPTLSRPQPIQTNAPAAPPPVAKVAPVIAPPPSNPPPVRAEVKPITPAIDTNSFPRPAKDILEAQVALARLAISSGSIDGVIGSQTRAALLAFQRQRGLPETLELDEATRAALLLQSPALTNYVVTAGDLARLQPISTTWLGKSQQTALDYENILELVAERGHASPNLIRRLNPVINWTNVVAGVGILIPNVDYAKPAKKAGFIVISLGEKKLEAFDAQTNLLVHFPCSIAARVEKRPAGELHVAAIAESPNYTFDPEVFPESAEAKELNRKLILPPGPNNPVGTAWISLDKPGYGMHGTPSPEQVGRTESHGCFRLANWNASYLVQLVSIGMPVYVEP